MTFLIGIPQNTAVITSNNFPISLTTSITSFELLTCFGVFSLSLLLMPYRKHPTSPLINSSIFFLPGYSYFNPRVYELVEKVSDPEKLFETIYLC